MLIQFLDYLTICLNVIGAFIIGIGALQSVAEYAKTILKFRFPDINQLQIIRLDLGHSIVLGIEFLLASDIIKTIITPDYYEIGILASLVIIRSILTYFLNQELEGISKID